ncbi:DUF2490 domain-containing protein [candidate division KSB1 bacterium]|nr:DUF2490 domain-containing protein [candidate division KSB1 bacterium]
MKNLFSGFLISLLLLSLTFAKGDVQFWNTESISCRVNNRITLTTDLEYRFDERNNNYYQHTHVSADYKVLPWLRIGPDFRQVYTRKPYSSQSWARYTEYMPMMHASLKAKYRQFDLGYRLRFEERIFENTHEQLWRLRNRADITYALTFLPLNAAAFIGDEIFLQEEKTGVYRNWFFAGIQGQIKKIFVWRAFYQLQSELKSDVWDKIKIFRLQLKLSM